MSEVQTIPTGVGRGSRAELDEVELTTVDPDTSVPDDVGGHVFIVAPVGNVGELGKSREFGDPIFNGDGMIYRIDLTAGRARVKTRLVKTPCYYADEATQADPKLAGLAFHNRGLLRLSAPLGMRNFANTAFVPFKFGTDGARLLVTYDAGRPLEIDPSTLEVITPVGRNDEWKAEALEGRPFEPVLATAHPVADARTGEIFAVNFGRSIRNLARNEGLANLVDALPDGVEKTLEALVPRRPRLLDVLTRLGSTAVTRGAQAIGDGLGLRGLAEDFVDLVSWSGHGRLRRWRVVKPNGSPVVIDQSMHQMAVTRDFVVLMDTALKIELDQVYRVPFSHRFDTLARIMRLVTTQSQHPYTWIYVIRRTDLRTANANATVTATPMRLGMEALHFIAEYENPDDRITLHVAHNNALDFAEWIRPFDVVRASGRRCGSDTLGMPCVAGMDMSTLGRWTVDMGREELRIDGLLRDDPCTWGVTLYAGNDLTSDAPAPEHVDTMFWCSIGLFPDALTGFIHELYDDYPRRTVTLADIDRLCESGGRTSSVYRVDTRTMEVVDRHELGSNRVASSLQFVPRNGGAGGPLDGYLVCTVLDGDQSQLWLFDAADLGAPVCKLSHPGLQFGLTLHTAWLPTLARRTPGYRIHPQDDLGPKVEHDRSIRRMLEKYVYPHFD